MIIHEKVKLNSLSVEVTVRGPVDPLTGMVMNLEDLKDCMQKVLMDQMDHKNIDKQVDHFRETVSTTENVAIYIFEELKKHMSNPELLYEVKVHETDKNVMCFRGEYVWWKCIFSLIRSLNCTDLFIFDIHFIFLLHLYNTITRLYNITTLKQNIEIYAIYVNYVL